MLPPGRRTADKLSQSADNFPALGFDPAPGDLSGVSLLSEKYKNVSDKLKSTQESLNAILNQTGLWEGEAAEAFAGQVDELPEYLDKATDSMAKAASALSQWNSSLGDMQRQARELELEAQRARRKVEEAESNPALGLINQTFCDLEGLQRAQRLLERAERRLDEAVNNFDEIIESAKRLVEQHTAQADEIAALLRQARDIAPDEPGLLSRLGEAFAGLISDTIGGIVDTVSEVAGAIGDFIEEHADVIATVSDILGDIGTVVGFVPGLQGASAVLGGLSLAGNLVAKAGGADVSWDSIVLGGIGLGAGKFIKSDLVGNAVDFGSQALYEIQGEGILGDKTDTFIGNYAPKNDRQWMQLAGGVLFPPLAPASLGAIGAENMVQGWGEGLSESVGKKDAFIA